MLGLRGDQCARSAHMSGQVHELLLRTSAPLRVPLNSRNPCFWHQVLPAVRSVTLQCETKDFPALPAVIELAGNLGSLSLAVGTLGTPHEPLKFSHALAGLEHLALHCMDVHVHIPADVAWHDATVHARNALCVAFEDAAAFAASVPTFCFKYRTAEGTAMPDLAVALARAHPAWSGTFGAGSESGLVFPGPAAACTWTALAQCSCGACQKCLVKAGIMQETSWTDGYYW